MHPFAYIAPKTVEEAVKVLDKHGERARPLAGGTDLLVQVRGDRFEMDAIVDIKNIPDLMKVQNDSHGLRMGAAVPCYMLYENEDIAHNYPGIIDAASLIGGIQIQSRAGLAGNLCNSSPSADGVCPLVVHRAKAHIAGPHGERDVAAEDFCTGPGRNVLQKGEMVTMIEIPKPTSGFGAAYERFIPRNEMDIAVVGCASSVNLEGDGKTFTNAIIALAAVGPIPIVAREAADYLKGKAVTDENIAAAAKLACEAISPINDMRGTVTQRKKLSEVLARRTIKVAVERARKSI